MNNNRFSTLPTVARAAFAVVLSATLAFGVLPAAAFADSGTSQSDDAALLAIRDGSAAAVADVALGEPDGAPDGGDYNKYNFYTGLPWCGHFVVWCAREAGVPESVVPNMYNCAAMMAFYQSRGEWHDWSYIPNPGDIVFYSYGGYVSHVGIVTSVANGYVYLKEGNTNNTWCGRVGSFARPVGTWDTGGWGNIVGYASPSYPAATETYLFDDVPASAWYVTDGGYLDYVVGQGLMGGVSGDGTLFAPEDKATRGQVATILYRAATGATAESTDNNVDTPFSDVKAGSYAAAAVNWAQANGVVEGYKDASGQLTGVFGVDDYVTREQIATMVARCAKYCGIAVDPDVAAAFSTVQGADQLASWSYKEMAWCIEQGIITGDTSYSPAAILPQKTATRAELTKIMTVFARDVL